MECRASIRKFIYLFLIILAIGIQIFLAFRYQVQLGWDNTDTITSAIGIVTNDADLFSINYFEIYRNQRCFLLTSALIVWIARGIGISYSQLPVALSLVDIFFVDFAMLISYFAVKELKGKESAEKLIIWMLINPGLYLWGSYYYTTNISLFTMCVAIFLLIRMWKKGQKWYVYFLSGMFFWFGIQYRATLVIVLVGAVAMAVLKKPYNLLKGTALIALGALVMQLTLNIAYATYIPVNDSENAFPVSHWLMMGAQGVGAYNDEDVFFTASQGTKEERAKADLELYKERLKKLGIKGSMELAVRKMTYNWSYGNHGYEPEFQYYDTLYDFLWGTKNTVILCYEQIYHLALICLIIIALALSWIKGAKGIVDLAYLPFVTLLGGILFYILWETNPYYSVGFLTVMLICSIDGVEGIAEVFKRIEVRCVKPGHKGIVGSIICIGIAVCVCLGIFFANEYLYTGKGIPVISQTKVCDVLFFNGDNTISQNFVADRDFDSINFWITKEKRKEDSTGIYEISLVGEERGTVFSEKIYNQDVYRTIDYEKKFDRVYIEDEERFTLKISTVEDDPDNRMGICFYNLPVDACSKGELLMDGRKIQGDLMFNVWLSEY